MKSFTLAVLITVVCAALEVFAGLAVAGLCLRYSVSDRVAGQVGTIASCLATAALYKLVFSRFAPGAPKLIGSIRPAVRASVFAVAFVVLAFALVVLGASLWSQQLPMVGVADVEWQPFQFLRLATIAVDEELVFRGFVLSLLLWLRRPWLANLGQAVLFTAIHLVERRPDNFHLLFVFVMGLILGRLVLRCGSLLPGAVAHVLVNLVATSSSNSVVANALGGRGAASGMTIEVALADNVHLGAALNAAVFFTLFVAWVIFDRRHSLGFGRSRETSS